VFPFPSQNYASEQPLCNPRVLGMPRSSMHGAIRTHPCALANRVGSKLEGDPLMGPPRGAADATDADAGIALELVVAVSSRPGRVMARASWRRRRQSRLGSCRATSRAGWLPGSHAVVSWSVSVASRGCSSVVVPELPLGSESTQIGRRGWPHHLIGGAPVHQAPSCRGRDLPGGPLVGRVGRARLDLHGERRHPLPGDGD
jgi:hypothetical protein